MAKLIEKLGEELVSLEEAKMQCYIDPTEQDAVDDLLLTRLIHAARAIAEARTWKGLLYGRYRQTLRGFPSCEIELARPPLHEVETITYLSESGEELSLESSQFYVDTESTPGLIGPVSSWPITKNIPGAVVITYTAGYKHEAGEDDPPSVVVPENIRAAMLILIKFMFDNRDLTVPDRSTPMSFPRQAMDLLDDVSAGVTA